MAGRLGAAEEDDGVVEQVGSAMLTWATNPVPKNDFSLAKVRSMNWSTMTKLPGLSSSLSDPTAEKETIRSTPARLRASMFAR